MGRKTITWTKNDIDYLKSNYGKITAKKIAAHLNITPHKVIRKANQLGLKSKLIEFKNRSLTSQILLKIKARGFILLEAYQGIDTKIKIQCFCGKEIMCKPRGIAQGERTSCGCKRGWKLRQGTEFVNLTYFNNIKHHATNKNREFKITIDYISDLLVKQDFKCALSGINIECAYKDSHTASLDRIDSSKGYIEGNVQWVHKVINDMKSNREDKLFIEYCRAVAEFNKDKNEH